MRVLIIKVYLRAQWVHSLKEKRMILKSIISRLRNKFNVSVSEIDYQDIHKEMVIGIVAICGTTAIADSTMENIISFIEENTDAEITSIEHEKEIFSNNK